MEIIVENKFVIHTNIALDYPTIWTGSIYTEQNVTELFNSDEFVEKIASGNLVGTVGSKLGDIKPNLVSHIVTDAIITNDKEIIFEISTLDNKAGKALSIMLYENPQKYLAKMIAKISVDSSSGGVRQLLDIKYVNIDEIQR